MSLKTHFVLCSLLMIGSQVHAGMVFLNEPKVQIIPKVGVETISSTASSSFSAAARADNFTAAKASKMSDRASWAVTMPKGSRDLCIANICLGDPIDVLPSKSVNASGYRVSGDWLQPHVQAIPGDNSVMAWNTKNRDSLQVFEDMRETLQVCSLKELGAPLKPRMHLLFFPDDGSQGGIEVIADLLPKKRQTLKSTYAISQIRMLVRSADGLEATTWPAAIAAMWPGLQPFPLPATAGIPQRIVMWASFEDHAKDSLIRDENNAIYYDVSPLLSATDKPFNMGQWDEKPVTHKLQWLSGIYGFFGSDFITPAQLQLVEGALQKQPGCAQATTTTFPARAVSAEPAEERRN